MADYDLGTARGKIDIDASGAVTGYGAASLAHDKTMGKLNTAGQTLTKTGLLLGGIGIAAVAGFGFAVNAAANFEQRMNGIKAVSGASAGEIDQLRNKALQLGKDTVFSADEAASAIEELVKAGISVPDVLNGAADAAVNLAAATGLDIPSAANLAAQAMNAFHLSAKDLPGVADAIAGAANASAIDVNEFAAAFQQAAGVADLVGVSFDDTATAIAVMGQAGIKGSDAGTSLKQMLLGLHPQTDKQAELMKQLGLVTLDGANQFYDATGKLKPFREVVDILANSLSGMTDEQKSATLETLFGSDAIRASGVLVNAGAASFDQMAAAMKKVSAEDVAATRMGGFKGALEQLKGSLETLLIQVGAPFLKFLTKVANGILGFVNWLLELPGPIKKVFTVGGLLLGVVIGLAGALSWATGTALKMAGNLKKLGEGMALARDAIKKSTAIQWLWNAALNANPIGVIIIALAALAAIVYVFYTKWDQVWSWIKDNPAYAAILAFLSTFISPLILIGFVIAAVAKNWRKAWEWIKQAASDAWDWIQVAASDALEFLKALPDKVWSFLQTLPDKFLQVATDAMNFLYNGFVAGLEIVLGFAISLPGKILDSMITLGSLMLQAGIDALTWLFNGLVAAAPVVFAFVISLPGQILSYLASLAGDMLNTGVAAITALWNGLKSLVGSILGWAGTLAHDIAAGIQGLGTMMWNLGVDAIQGLWNGLKSLAGDILDWVGNLAENIAGEIGGALGIGSPSKVLMQIGKWTMEGLQIGLNKGASGALSEMSSVAATLQGAAPSASGTAAASVGAVAPAGAEGGFTYINNGQHQSPSEMVGEYFWQKLTRTGSRAGR